MSQVQPPPDPQRPGAPWWAAFWPPGDAETAVVVIGSGLMFLLGLVSVVAAIAQGVVGFGVLALVLFVLGFLGPGLASLTLDTRRGIIKGTTHKRRIR